jgi:glyoxylase-like metal-dependent hydrolase (beta-lactamase superfamily II)
LTHAHFDHTAAIEQFPNATVYVGPGDKELLKGERETDGVMAKMMANLTGAPAHHPKKIRVIQDNVPLIIDGQKITPIHVAGHTHGSVVYLWRKILFTGDTVVGRDGYVNELPKPLYANYKAVPRNLKKVLQHDFDVLADGHVGIHKNGYKLIKEYLAKNGFRELSSNLKEKTMSDSKATLVVTAVPNPEGMEEMQKYLKGVVPVLVGNGGEILVRAKADKAVVGDVNFGMILVMSFASKGAIETTFESDEYKALIPLRDKGFKKMDVTIVDAM